MRTALIASVIAIAPAAQAAPVHEYRALALSPAGDRIAAVEPTGIGGHSAIVLRSAADGKILTTIDPCAACSYAGLTFAADGALAFVARSGGTATLTIWEQGRTRSIATVTGLAATPRFSPDSRRIAVLVTIGAAKETGAAQAGVRQIGEIGAISDTQRIAVFDRTASVAAADVRPVSPADRFIYEFDWTPDGRGFVVTSALGNGDDNWWTATLDAVDASTGNVRSIAKPSTQLNFPRVSPDGTTVAYIGGLMSDFGSVGGDVWTVPLAGGTPVDITPDMKASATSLDWTGGGLRATLLAGDRSELAVLTPGKAPATRWSSPVSTGAGDGRAAWSADGEAVAMVVQDYMHAPAIHAGPLAAPRQLTHDNDGVAALTAARSISWQSDGHAVQGWLLAPLNADPKRKAPMVTVVHGGPAAASVPSFVTGGSQADLLAAGYYIFFPNPRGSYGQGEAFTAANRRDFGGGDLRDILAGIDAVEKVAPIDDGRLGLSGGSYGGFMAMWANTQTNRFKAIVAGAGLSNWVSYYGTNGIDQWMIPFFGKSMYEDRAAYEAVSAVNFVKAARTPTFIYVGERDIEVPPTQSIEWWHALHAVNVPTTLVIYPDEGHGIRGADHAADLRKRTMAWFDRYLGTGAK